MPCLLWGTTTSFGISEAFEEICLEINVLSKESFICRGRFASLMTDRCHAGGG